ncbi:MAG: YciI family protein, partial [Gemmatimonadetes bacterium]|nr:YciI family protein [Gemmatimonadota bacterium]
FAAGLIAGQRTAASTDPPMANGSRYLLVLYEDESFRPDRPGPEMVREYSAWAAALRSEGRLSMGEQLGHAGWLIDRGAEAPSPDTGPYGQVTGFFVIVANDRAHALDIARSCPHIRYGGRIAVQPIVDT